jgi:hypothetical protein
MENDKQYVSKINGYYVKDLETDEKLDDLETEINGEITNLNTDISAINGEITTIEENYFDKSKIYELEVTLTGVADTFVNESINLPTGYNCSNTTCVYYYISYNVGNNAHSPCRIFTNPNLAIYISEVNIPGHELAPNLTVAFKGTASTVYKITIGLLKIENENEGE